MPSLASIRRYVFVILQLSVSIHLSRSNQPAHILRGPPRKEESCLRKIVDNLSLLPFDLIWDRTIKYFYILELDPEKNPKISGMMLSLVNATKMSYTRPG